jgi:ribonuclease-3
MSTRIIRNIGGNITSCERILKYQFRKKILCLKALNAGGIPIEYDGRTHQLARNDAMAVLGDARMEALLCRRWWASGVRNKGM